MMFTIIFFIKYNLVIIRVHMEQDIEKLEKYNELIRLVILCKFKYIYVIIIRAVQVIRLVINNFCYVNL